MILTIPVHFERETNEEQDPSFRFMKLGLVGRVI